MPRIYVDANLDPLAHAQLGNGKFAVQFPGAKVLLDAGVPPVWTVYAHNLNRSLRWRTPDGRLLWPPDYSQPETNQEDPVPKEAALALAHLAGRPNHFGSVSPSAPCPLVIDLEHPSPNTTAEHTLGTLEVLRGAMGKFRELWVYAMPRWGEFTAAQKARADALLTGECICAYGHEDHVEMREGSHVWFRMIDRMEAQVKSARKLAYVCPAYTLWWRDDELQSRDLSPRPMWLWQTQVERLLAAGWDLALFMGGTDPAKFKTHLAWYAAKAKEVNARAA